MKKFCILIVVIFLFGSNLFSQNNSGNAFEKLKTLEGNWNATLEDGSIVKVSYEIVSNKSVVMETIEEQGTAGMITMYHLNGDKLMVTHYCSAGNQPRMVADLIDPEVKRLKFNFLDVTDVDEDEGYMTNIDFSFEDIDHFTQTWTFKKDENSLNSIFVYERVK